MNRPKPTNFLRKMTVQTLPRTPGGRGDKNKLKSVLTRMFRVGSCRFVSSYFPHVGGSGALRRTHRCGENPCLDREPVPTRCRDHRKTNQKPVETYMRPISTCKQLKPQIHHRNVKIVSNLTAAMRISVELMSSRPGYQLQPPLTA